MTLDLTALGGKFQELADGTDAQSDGTRFDALSSAYAAASIDALLGRLETARTSWLVARPRAPFGEYVDASPPPHDYTVVASDGSFILPDRHTPARFYVINIGKVVLRYGSAPSADLRSDPSMYFREEELFVPRDVRKIPVTGPVLGLKRAAEELGAVTSIALEQSGPTLALQDGTLILWALESQPESVVSWVLDDYLEAMRALERARVPLAAYISFPGSNDVMNSLRVSICDYPDHGWDVNCDHCRSRIELGHVPACDVLPDVTDRTLFAEIAALPPGARSPVFASSSKILKRYDDTLRVAFFYLNTGTEIARVEVPEWVTADPVALDFTHAAIYEQCQLGRGYPSALQEAHELAAIRPDERRAVEVLVEEALARRGVVLRRSGKDQSKRARYV
jgi:hypothetical protein